MAMPVSLSLLMPIRHDVFISICVVHCCCQSYASLMTAIMITNDIIVDTTTMDTGTITALLLATTITSTIEIPCNHV